MKHLYLCFWLLFTQCATLHAQDSLINLPDRYLSQVGAKAGRIQRLMDRKSRKAFQLYQQQEQHLMARLQKLNPEAAQNIFDGPMKRMEGLKGKLYNKAGKLVPAAYNGYLDTLQGSLKFLKNAKGLVKKSSLTHATEQVEALQDRIAVADELNELIEQRRQELKEQLAQYAELAGPLKDFQKTAYYYSKQVKEYKAMLADPQKAERKAMELLQRSEVFQKFMSRNSIFSQLFAGMAGGGTDLSVLQDLQTRNSVEQLLNTRLGNGDQGRQLIAAQMDAARSKFDEYKKKFSNLATAGEVPEFKPKAMKVKRFLKRLEPGGNIQFQRSQYFFPVLVDIAAQLAYQFHKNGSLGVGFSYKLGAGKGWDQIRLSNEGFGFRAFLDWKLKANIFLAGGIDANHFSSFKNFAELKNWNGWQYSGLIGLSKKTQVRGKKKIVTSLLYDILAPGTAPFFSKFKTRIGYTF